jgi:pyridoxine 4-dehydrogenase
MTDITAAGVFSLGDRTVNRLGYGAMQLAGPGVFGPPKDPDAALAVLRAAVASGVNPSLVIDVVRRAANAVTSSQRR